MNSRSFWLLAVFLAAVLGATVVFAAGYYRVYGVKRVDQNLYRTSSGVYIQTRYCYRYAYGEDAVLKWEGPYGDSKIIWSDNSSCQVKRVFK